MKPPEDDAGKDHLKVISVVNVDPCNIPFIEQVVVTVNTMRKRVSMLTKELVLQKLESGEQLPLSNHSFYSALATSLRTGRWKHGYDAMLHKRRVADPKLGTVLSPAGITSHSTPKNSLLFHPIHSDHSVPPTTGHVADSCEVCSRTKNTLREALREIISTMEKGERHGRDQG